MNGLRRANVVVGTVPAAVAAPTVAPPEANSAGSPAELAGAAGAAVAGAATSSTVVADGFGTGGMAVLGGVSFKATGRCSLSC